jgi:hypothetical protein
VEGIEIYVSGNPAGAADARNYHGFVQGNLAFLKGLGKTVHGGADAAGGTPNVRHPVHAQKIFERVFINERVFIGHGLPFQ